MKKHKKITSFSTHLDKQYGVVGTKSRAVFESEFENFKLGTMIREARKKAQLTQDQLARKIQTKRSFISRVEHDASDVRFSTLRRIVNGLGGKLHLDISM